MKYGRIDANQPIIVEHLRRCGFAVAITSDLGDGFPDIIVSTRGINFMFEIKDPSKPEGKRRLTEKEKEFHSKWKGQIDVIETAEDAIKIMDSTLKKQSYEPSTITRSVFQSGRTNAKRKAKGGIGKG